MEIFEGDKSSVSSKAKESKSFSFELLGVKVVVVGGGDDDVEMMVLV
jgi:hypothetical protein